MCLVLPVQTDRPRLRPAYLTLALLALNVTAFAALRWAPSASAGLLGAPDASGAAQAVPLAWRLGLWGSHPSPGAFLSYPFVHASVLHLAGNMLFLWLFGSLIEDCVCAGGLAVLYFAGGIAAALAHLSLAQLTGADADVPLVGASGAVAALMGFFLVRFFRTRVRVIYLYWLARPCTGAAWLPASWGLLGWAGLELCSGVWEGGGAGGGTAHWAHVGGFLGGMLLAPLLGGSGSPPPMEDPQAAAEAVRREGTAADLRRLLRERDPDPARLLGLAREAGAHGEYDLAGEACLRALDRFADAGRLPDAVEAYRELMRLDEALSPSPERLRQLAEHLEAVGSPEAAYVYRRLGIQVFR